MLCDMCNGRCTLPSGSAYGTQIKCWKCDGRGEIGPGLGAQRRGGPNCCLLIFLAFMAMSILGLLLAVSSAHTGATH